MAHMLGDAFRAEPMAKVVGPAPDFVAPHATAKTEVFVASSAHSFREIPPTDGTESIAFVTRAFWRWLSRLIFLVAFLICRMR